MDHEPRLPIGAQAALDAILGVCTAAESTAEPADERSLIDLRDLDLRNAVQPVDPYYDLGAIAENAPLTENLFTAAPD